MTEDELMRLSPKEFYGLYGLKAELYSEKNRLGDTFDPDGCGHGIMKCDDTGMTDPKFRSLCIHLAMLYDGSGPTPPEPPSGIPLTEVQPGENLRGKTIMFTHTDKAIGVFNDEAIVFTNGSFFVGVTFDGTADGVIIGYNDAEDSSRTVTVYVGSSMGGSGWTQTTLTFPDIDLFVDSNTLQEGTATTWGFDDAILISS